MARSTTKAPITEQSTPTMSEASRARCMNCSVKGSVSQEIIAAPRAVHGCAGALHRRHVARAALVDHDHAAHEERLAAERLAEVLGGEHVAGSP